MPRSVLELWMELQAGQSLRPDGKPAADAASGVIGGVPMGVPPELRKSIKDSK